MYGHLPPISQTIKARQTRHAGKIKMKSSVMFSNGLLYMDKLELADQQRLKYITSLWTLSAASRTFQAQWTIETNEEKESRDAIPLAWLYDDFYIKVNKIHSILFLVFGTYLLKDKKMILLLSHSSSYI